MGFILWLIGVALWMVCVITDARRPEERQVDPLVSLMFVAVTAMLVGWGFMR